MRLRENELAYWVSTALQEMLPRGWLVEVVLSPTGPGDGWEWDAELLVKAPDGAATSIPVAAKARATPVTVARIAEGAVGSRSPAESWALLVSDYLSPGTRKACIDRGLGYADRTGAWRLSLERPAVVIDQTGAKKNPTPDTRGFSSLRGRGAARLVRALVDWFGPWDPRTLMSRARVSGPTVSKVIALLESESLVERTRGRSVGWVDWAGLIRRWALDYKVELRNRPQYFLDPRGAAATLSRLKGVERPYAVTGGVAAERAVGMLPRPRLLLYAANPDELAAELGVGRASPVEANVVILLPYDDSLVLDAPRDGLVFAPWSQVAVDLLTGRDRETSAGSILLEWMSSDERRWRKEPGKREISAPRRD